MNAYKKITIMFCLALLTFSCGEDGLSEKSAHSNHEDNELILDNGKKWIANIETTTNIHEMIQIMNEFEKSTDVADYHLLKERLEKKFKNIFDECTMKGEAHEQLHNYMLPMKSMFPGLTGDDLSACSSSYDELKIHLSEYNKFFE